MDNQQTINQAPMTNSQPTGHNNFLFELENIFDKYLNKQAPFHLPAEIKEFIVKYGPWVDLVLLILTLPIILAAFGLLAFVLPFGVMMHPFASIQGILSWIISIGAFGLQVAALPGLFRRSMSSWRLMYYAALLSAVGSLVYLNIINLILGLLVSMYLLFQIKEKYH